MGPRRGVLVTRPAEEADATAARISELGFAPVLCPALRLVTLERLPVDAFAGAQAVIATSAAALTPDRLGAVQAGAAPPLYAVGAKTAAAARAAGFADVREAAGAAASMLPELLTLRPQDGPLAVLRGRDVAADLSGDLRAAGFVVVERALYAAEPARDAPEAALKALDGGEIGAALFLSARTVAAFLALARSIRRDGALADIAAVCNSARTAGPALASGAFARVEIATAPTLEATLDALRAAVAPEG